MRKSIKSLMAVTLLAGSLVGCGMADTNNQARTRAIDQRPMAESGFLGTTGPRADSGFLGGTNRRAESGFLGDTTRRAESGYLGTYRNNSAGIRNTTDTDNAAFTDVPETRWSRESIEWARDQGIMQGMGQGMFNPTQPLTREQMAAVIKNLADKGYIVVRDEEDETPAVDETPTTPTTPATPEAGDTPTADETPATPETPAGGGTTPPATQTPVNTGS